MHYADAACRLSRFTPVFAAAAASPGLPRCQLSSNPIVYSVIGAFIARFQVTGCGVAAGCRTSTIDFPDRVQPRLVRSQPRAAWIRCSKFNRISNTPFQAANLTLALVNGSRSGWFGFNSGDTLRYMGQHRLHCILLCGSAATGTVCLIVYWLGRPSSTMATMALARSGRHHSHSDVTLWGYRHPV